MLPVEKGLSLWGYFLIFLFLLQDTLHSRKHSHIVWVVDKEKRLSKVGEDAFLYDSNANFVGKIAFLQQH